MLTYASRTVFYRLRTLLPLPSCSLWTPLQWSNVKMESKQKYSRIWTVCAFHCSHILWFLHIFFCFLLQNLSKCQERTKKCHHFYLFHLHSSSFLVLYSLSNYLFCSCLQFTTFCILSPLISISICVWITFLPHQNWMKKKPFLHSFLFLSWLFQELTHIWMHIIIISTVIIFSPFSSFTFLSTFLSTTPSS